MRLSSLRCSITASVAFVDDVTVGFQVAHANTSRADLNRSTTVESLVLLSDVFQLGFQAAAALCERLQTSVGTQAVAE